MTLTPLNANRILEVPDTGTVLTSDIPFKSINRKPTSAWHLCHSEHLAWIILIYSQQALYCCLEYQTCVITKYALYFWFLEILTRPDQSLPAAPVEREDILILQTVNICKLV